LRQLSLDLRGRPPSIDELDAVARDGRVSPERIDAMLRSDEFVAQVRAWHKPLLWPNVDNFQIGTVEISAWEELPQGGYHVFPPAPELVEGGQAKHPAAALNANLAELVYLRGDGHGCDSQLEYPPPAEHGLQPTYAAVGSDRKTRRYPYYDPAGVPLPYHDAAHCPNYCSSKTDDERRGRVNQIPGTAFSPMNAAGADRPPHELDPPGMHCPPAFPYRVINACDATSLDAGVRNFAMRRDGFRWTTPYWSHGQKLKTCAYEAQTRTISLATDSPPCGVASDVSCGCGPDGIYCTPSSYAFRAHGLESRADHDIRSGIDQEPLEIVASVVAADDDYFEIFTTRRAFATGPLSLFYRRQYPAAIPFTISPPAPASELPQVPYEDATWHEYVRGPEHSGVLTTTAYLARFPTWRSRVSQFRTEFMCRPFTPSVAAVAGPDDACAREPNLAKRCGCKSCHATIEPMTAWFGRWAERSVQYLDPSAFPAFDPECEPCAIQSYGCPARCNQYVSRAIDAEGARYAGTLRGYLYRTPEEEKRIEQGPRGLVEAAIASGELEACTVRTAWKQLVGRAMTEEEDGTSPGADVEASRLGELEKEFERHHRRYRELVRAIVTSPEYRSFE
jgi:hypothetical protein